MTMSAHTGYAKNHVSRRALFGCAAAAGLGLACAPIANLFGSKKALADETGNDRFGQFTFDLTKPGVQSYTITREDGTEETFGIEVPQQTRASDVQNLGSGYGDFKAFWYTGLINISFMVRVDNYLISYCYDPWAGAAATPIYSIVIDWTNLDWGSTWCRMATAYHDSGFGINEIKYIDGAISGTQLVYTYWIG